MARKAVWGNHITKTTKKNSKTTKKAA